MAQPFCGDLILLFDEHFGGDSGNVFCHFFFPFYCLLKIDFWQTYRCLPKGGLRHRKSYALFYTCFSDLDRLCLRRLLNFLLADIFQATSLQVLQQIQSLMRHISLRESFARLQRTDLSNMVLRHERTDWYFRNQYCCSARSNERFLLSGEARNSQ